MSREVLEKVAALEAYRSARVVLAYSGFGSELQTGGFLRRVLEEGETLGLTRVNRERKFLACGESATDLTTVELGAMDFALVPGVAFDARGGRLGHGAGSYDRLLSSCAKRPPLVAGAFEAQIVEEVPVTPHDALMDTVITERGYYPRTMVSTEPGSLALRRARTYPRRCHSARHRIWEPSG